MANLKMMTHVVAGYPSMEKTEELVKLMAKSGADMIEIQIPFTDPLADGPTIMKANQAALDNKTNINDCFDLAERLVKQIDVPLLFMTYANVPFAYGIENFIKKAAECGMYGLIIPDLTYDEDNENYLELCNKYNINAVQVISPDMKEDRLKDVLSVSMGFVYTTLKVGITGAQKSIDPKGLEYISIVKKYTDLPIAAGFGISSPDMFNQLDGISEYGVVGSHVLNLFDKEGIEAVEKFIKDCKY